MEAQFTSHLKNHFPYIIKSKLLLAVSGGLDSMVLLHLCKNQNLDIAIAHCNFKLRGEESDQETAFVKQEAHRLSIACHVNYFDTYAYAKAKKISTQMAARDLRYDWFLELARKYECKYILTAHHLNDTVETFLINISRGTGLNGLTGIPMQNENVVRPLLPFSRKQIKEYAFSQDIKWREDSSNASDDYVRNAIRHNAIPAIETAVPNFLEGVVKTQEYVSQSVALLNAYTEQLKQELTYPINSIMGPRGFCIQLEKLGAHALPDAVLYALLHPFNFTAWKDIYELPLAQSGKKIYSQSHMIFKDRDTLQILPLSAESTTEKVYWIENGEVELLNKNWKLEFQETKDITLATKNEIFVDKNRLTYPLQIRSWKEGDFFYPLGLGGKKKLSKFFKDEKLSLVQKQHVLMLCSGSNIVWVIGMRPDDRFKVTDTTKTILKISYYTNEV